MPKDVTDAEIVALTMRNFHKNKICQKMSLMLELSVLILMSVHQNKDTKELISESKVSAN
jgi:hypothetical protein